MPAKVEDPLMRKVYLCITFFVFSFLYLHEMYIHVHLIATWIVIHVACVAFSEVQVSTSAVYSTRYV